MERRKIEIGPNECNSVAVQEGTSPNNAEQDYTMPVYVAYCSHRTFEATLFNLDRFNWIPEGCLNRLKAYRKQRYDYCQRA